MLAPAHTIADGRPLVVVRINHFGGRIEEQSLTLGRFIIGRKNAHIMLGSDRSASRRHAEIEVCGSRIELRDLGSTNGTFDGVGNPVTQVDLDCGASVRIGATVLTVVCLAFDSQKGVPHASDPTGQTAPAMPAAISRRPPPRETQSE